MMKTRTTIAFTLLATMFGFFGSKDASAQDPEFTQFYAQKLYLNPAFAGSHNCPRVQLNYRNQWPGLSGTFVTMAASYDQHVQALGGGLGFMVVADDAANGTLKTTRISGMYAYQLKLGRKFSMRFGVEATYFQRVLDWNKLTFGDMIDPRRGFIYQTNDVPRGGSIGNMDFAAGVLGFTEEFFFGVSAHHLTEPNESLVQGDSPLPLKLSGHAGANIPLGNSKYSETAVLSPAIMYRQQAAFSQLNLGLYVRKGALTGGVWYRNKDAFIVTLGIHSGIFRFGYSYDVTVSKLTNATAGSHELSIGFDFNCKPKRRTFRTISCPSF